MNPAAVTPSLSVGDGISVETARWSFGGETAGRFDEHVARSVPGYDDGHQIVEQLSDFFVGDAGRVIEVGCSTGTLIARLAQRHSAVDADFLGVDVVPEMVALARERCANLGRTNIEVADGCRVDYTDANFVVMYYALQFIPVHRRARLLHRIVREMRPGGALVLFEKTRLPTPTLQDVCAQMYDAFKRERGFTATEILNKTGSLRGVMEPLTTDLNRRLLTQAGLVDAHLVYKYLAFEGIVATKPVVGWTGVASDDAASHDHAEHDV